jgi:hypothetical protein
VEGILTFKHPWAGHVNKQLEILTAAAFNCLNQVCICTLHFLPSSCLPVILQMHMAISLKLLAIPCPTNDVLSVLAEVAESLKVLIC